MILRDNNIRDNTVNIKNDNIRDLQFGGASRDINTALPRASPQKDPKPDKDKEQELRIRTKTKNKD